MSTDTSTPESVALRVNDICNRINHVFEKRKTARLYDAWVAAEVRLRHILDQSMQRPQVTVCLVGGTGAGKSTLLNAILDCRVLPIGNQKACTAAISKVTYAQQSHYEAEVKFISRQEWHKEIELLLADIADAKGSVDPSERAYATDCAEMTEAAKAKIKAVYGPISDEEIAHLTMFQARAKEPPEITQSLDSGSHQVIATDLEEFRKKIEQYLKSSYQFWPIVKSVEIRGPFATLSSGVTLVDLPGLNDPNEAREAVTNHYLKTSRFVWIVFNVKRVLTKDMMAVILSGDFRRRIVMDGRAGALTFVGTHSDSFDFESAREELALSDTASEIDVLLARNEAIRREVHAQLREHSARLVQQSGEEDGSRIDSLAEAFGKSKIFSVSAPEYLRLTGHSKGRPLGIENIEQTEIGALRDHMDRICSGYGVEAHIRSLHRQIDMIWEELVNALMQQKAYFDQQREATHQQIKRMEVEAEKARTFLESSLATTEEACKQDFASAQEILTERLKRAIDRARSELNVICSSWNSKHWATLRAIARRGGYFVGSTGTHDLAAEITKPILDGITFAWTDYFGDKLGNRLEKRVLGLLRVNDEHRLALLQIIEAVKENAPEFYKATADIIASTERILDERVKSAKVEMQEKIELRQRDLYDVIPGQVRANMVKAFNEAGSQEGSGMKRRMVEILSNHAKSVAVVMFQDVERTLLEGVRGLSDWLIREFGKMSETVRRQSDNATQNLRLDRTTMSSADVEETQEIIRSLQRELAELAPSENVAASILRALSGPEYSRTVSIAPQEAIR